MLLARIPPDPASLEALRRQYQDSGQAEREDLRFLVQKGHPKAARYRVWRRFFDSLVYPSGRGTRFYSFRSADEYSSYHYPYLDLGAVLHASDGEITSQEQFNQWYDLILMALWQDFAPALSPDYSSGSWIIQTSDAAFADALAGTGAPLQGTLTEGYTLEIRSPGYGDFQRIKRLIDAFHHDAVLPRRRSLRQARRHSTGRVCADLDRFELAGVPDAWL